MFNSSNICDFLNEAAIEYQKLGPANDFDNVRPLEDCIASSLVWSKKTNLNLSEIKALTLILPTKGWEELPAPKDKTLILVNNPRLVYALLLKQFFNREIHDALGLHETSIFSNQKGNFFGKNTVISPDTVFGNNVIIHPNVVIYPNVRIGNNVEIGSGSIIGAPGFGYVRDTAHKLHHFPHIGGVTIKDCVTIGANTCIDSGGLSNTEIGIGVKIGNFCQIAHNVKIESDCLIAGRVQIGGGCIIGEGTEIWPSATISNKLRIGKHCDIKIGSVVVSNIKDGETVSGNFAVSHTHTLRDFAKKRSK